MISSSIEFKFSRSDDPDYDYVISSRNKGLMDDLYDFLLFDLKRHTDNSGKPKYNLDFETGVYHIYLKEIHVGRILTTYCHH